MGAEHFWVTGHALSSACTSIPTRVHGAFVSDDEVHKVVDRLKKSGEPEYEDSVLNGDLSELSGARW